MVVRSSSSVLDKWRDYFRDAHSDIFNIIEHAIMVAAHDCPYDFKQRRDRIAEMLFTCKMTKCCGCDRIELAVTNGGGGGDDGIEKGDGDDKYKSGVEDGGGSKDSKESKVNSNGDGDDYRKEVMEMNENRSYRDDAEALIDEMEVECKLLEEVTRIKETIDNGEEESNESLLGSLRQLELMPFSVEILKVTEIGKSVNSLRKHGSKEIRVLVRALIEDWKTMVDAWVEATAAVSGAEVATQCEKTPVEDEEGLPSPPLDEGAFFATPTSMEWSKFFDGMDDDGNPQNSWEFNKNRENGTERRPEENNTTKQKFESPNDSSATPEDWKAEKRRDHESKLKKQSPLCKPNRPPTGESGSARPKPPGHESSTRRPKLAAQPKVNHDVKVQQKSNKGTMQTKPIPREQEKSKCNNEDSVRMKLEAAKRKLQERYQEAENAKKQRTTQFVELHDLPKQSLKNQHARRTQGRR